jgi:hypothetical protein
MSGGVWLQCKRGAIRKRETQAAASAGAMW